MTRSRSLSLRQKAWLAVTLSWLAAYVDVVGYLALQKIYIANMTGNTASLAMAAASGEWSEVFRRGWPILTFVLGVFLGAFIIEVSKRKQFYFAGAAAFGLEALLLVGFITVGTPVLADGSAGALRSDTYFLLIALGAMMMGVQSSAIRQIGKTTLHTTYITGTITKLAEASAEYLVWLRARTRGRLRSRLWKALLVSPRQDSFRMARLMAGLWIAFAAGGVCGALAKEDWQLHSLILPVVIFVFIAVLDLFRPISRFAGERMD